MKLSKACIIGLVGSVLLGLSIIINFISVLTSDYYTADVLNILWWMMPIVGWILLSVFLFTLWGKCKKLDRMLGDSDY